MQIKGQILNANRLLIYDSQLLKWGLLIVKVPLESNPVVTINFQGPTHSISVMVKNMDRMNIDSGRIRLKFYTYVGLHNYERLTTLARFNPIRKVSRVFENFSSHERIENLRSHS